MDDCLFVNAEAALGAVPYTRYELLASANQLHT
jgi:hypothetical protein